MGWLAPLTLLAALQVARSGAAGWVATPPGATVGDTVWLERRFVLPPAWRLRAGRLGSGETVEALGDPLVEPGERVGAWLVRYPVVAWAPGTHRVVMPPVWRLGPGGEADSVAGGTASFDLASVIPDSLKRPLPRPALLPFRSGRRDLRPVLLAAAGSLLVLVGAVWWRRRPPRAIAAPARARRAAEVPDRRWVAAGEPKAVAARASDRLRAALARAVPEAHQGLSTPQCLAVLERHRPPEPEVAAVLAALDRVAFAGGSDGDVAALAQRARGLAERLAS